MIIRRPVRARLHGDDGHSMMEVVVGMTIMSIIMVVITGAISQIYSAVNRVEGTTVSRDQLGAAFRRLDRELRYAQWVATPGLVGGTRWYMEYAMPGQQCRQLAFNTGTGNLTLASWALPSTTPGTAVTVASSLQQAGTTAPFVVYAAGSQPYASVAVGTAGVGRNFSSDYVQVRVRLNAVVAKTTMPFDTLFTAQNTSRNTPALNDCSKGRPTT